MNFTYFIFMDSSGQTLFVRSDAEDGHFVHQEMTLTAIFPFDPAKRIEKGQRIAFHSVADDSIKVLEIRNVEEREPDHGQVITAEHICIAELSDEHINKTEITNKTASEALATALSGTLWSVGTNTASGTQNADFSRGSVWDAVNTIKENWNVYIEPRVVISSAGVITGRYLDISPAQGTFRGLRLSVRKNMTDPCVIYDDSEVLTALYGYGGNVDKAQASGDDKQEELTFASVVWTATSDHPAKPLNQTFLEWPEKTALYGRNGKARFGYYQNGSITDPAVLLEKTWEALKKTCDPKVTVQGGVIDLYRLGYKGQPIRLHDIAIIEIEETGTLLNKEIICFDEDLVNPDGDQVEIGDYIPNIIYINRETAKNARGGGGGGGRGQTNDEDEKIRTYTDFVKTDNMIGMVVGTRQGNNYIKAGQIILAINETGKQGSYETAAYVNADHVNISATNTAHLLAGSIVYDESGKLVLKDSSGAGIYIERQGGQASFGIWDKGNLTGGVMVQQINGQTGTITRIIGDRIVVGDALSIDADYRGKTLDGTLTAITTDFTSVNTLLAQKIEATDINAVTVQAAIGNMSFLAVNGLSSAGGVSAQGLMSCNTLSVNGHSMMIADAAVSADGTTLVLGLTNGGSITFRKGDTEAAYDQGWNDCIDAATPVTRYTRQTGTYGGNDYVHYIIQYGQYTNVGSGWWKTSQANAYTLPDPKPTT